MINLHLYCPKCHDIVSANATSKHKQDNEKHEGSDITPLREIREDGDRLIAQPFTKGHFTPHIWQDIDGKIVCIECGAVDVTPLYESGQ